MPATCLNISPESRVSVVAPGEAMLSLPGFAFEYAISSFGVFAGTDGCTTAMIGTVATRLIGAKSLTGSQGSLSKNAGAVANEVAAMNNVYPSGALRATCSAAMLPLAPGLFSTTIGWP